MIQTNFVLIQIKSDSDILLNGCSCQMFGSDINYGQVPFAAVCSVRCTIKDVQYAEVLGGGSSPWVWWHPGGQGRWYP